jgi:hypothetical protein
VTPGCKNEKAAHEGRLLSIGGVTDTLRNLDIADGDLARTAIRFGLERHLLPFAKTANSGSLKGCRVDENVLVTVVRLDEAKALLIVVELNCACIHCIALSFTDVCTQTAVKSVRPLVEVWGKV